MGISKRVNESLAKTGSGASGEEDPRAHTALSGETPKIGFHIIEAADDPRFDETFALFSSVFNHNGEPFVPQQAYRELFHLNHDEDFQRKIDPAKFTIIAAIDRETDRIVGGATQFAIIPDATVRRETGYDALYFAGFIFADEKMRGVGLAKSLIDTRENMVADYAREQIPALRDRKERGGNHPPPRVLGLHEQNDFLRMSMEDILEDIEISNAKDRPRNKWITPITRVEGARDKVGWLALTPQDPHQPPFIYMEPAGLRVAGVPYLLLAAKNAGETLPASLVSTFLRTYTTIRRRGGDPEDDPNYAPMMDRLRETGSFRTVNDSDFYRQHKPYLDVLLDYALPLRQLGAKSDGDYYMTTPVGQILQNLAGYAEGDHSLAIRTLQRCLAPASRCNRPQRPHAHSLV